ncbi:hypothetical protein LOTGIDRAFT_163180 [Lottia gigantea]|uniref:Uncharacterized protein n=1 Tax=Lottia gigantea TaxID=225164 RepID=V3ZKG2_LOTGI|nr:hypothetical protein LOTGIDRAFT_163180 [Lottia gigantea]ESO91818.1 hypothetical protein LOTGIDRAFT_163180 [Lottia gigantea]
MPNAGNNEKSNLSTDSDLEVSVRSESPSVKVSQSKKKTRSKRVSSTEVNNRLNNLEAKVDDKFDKLILLFTVCQIHQNTGCLTPRRSVRDENQDIGDLVSQIPKNSSDSGRIDPSGVPKLLINPEFRARNLEMDVLSLAPDEQEEREFMASLSDQESNLGPDSHVDLPHSPQKRLKSSADNNRPSYVNYLPETSTLQNTMKENVECQSSDVLSKLFGSSVNDDVHKVGLILDKSQSDTLSKSWRSQNPDRLTAYKEEYRSCFPVHELSEQFFNVPSLDDIYLKCIFATSSWYLYEQF